MRHGEEDALGVQRDVYRTVGFIEMDWCGCWAANRKGLY